MFPYLIITLNAIRLYLFSEGLNVKLRLNKYLLFFYLTVMRVDKNIEEVRFKFLNLPKEVHYCCTNNILNLNLQKGYFKYSSLHL